MPSDGLGGLRENPSRRRARGSKAIGQSGRRTSNASTSCWRRCSARLARSAPANGRSDRPPHWKARKETKMPMTIEKAQVALPSDREVKVTRSFKAPRALVYRAYTEPQLVQRWLL